MKKILLVCLVLLALTLVFIVCGGKEPANTTDQVDVTTSIPTTEASESTKIPVTTKDPESTQTPVTTVAPAIKAPGLYDDKDNLIASWDELVNHYYVRVDVDYSHDVYQENILTVLTNISALQNGTKLVIGDVERIGDRAFYGCKLTSIIIPDSVTSIGNYAFNECKKLSSITLGKGVTTIRTNAFYRCPGLKSILVHPNNPNYSSDGIALYNKDKTTLIQVPEGTTSFVIPDSVTTIGNNAFYGCTKLSGITIGKGVTSIASNEFEDWTSLEHILVNPNNPNFSSDGIALYNKDKTTLIQVPKGATSFTIPNSVTTIAYAAFESCTNLTSITIPDSVTTIAYAAFESCTSLTSITIPNNVTSIDVNAFSNCTSLEHILVNSNNESFSSDGIALYNKDKTLLIEVPKGATSFVIPNSVTTIGYNAFESCKNLTSVTIPDSVASISDHAFGNCTKLTNITIPDSVTLIGEQAFSNCESLISITIPNSVTSIGSLVFHYSHKLTSITFNGTLTQWKAIRKDHYWNKDGPVTEIVCTDGTETIK